MEISLTWAMAEHAGLTKKSNWRSPPEAMMRARAVSMLARMLFADVFAATHVYASDELGADDDVRSLSRLLSSLLHRVASSTGAHASCPTSCIYGVAGWGASFREWIVGLWERDWAQTAGPPPLAPSPAERGGIILTASPYVLEIPATIPTSYQPGIHRPTGACNTTHIMPPSRIWAADNYR
jgi:hypothetical protein